MIETKTLYKILEIAHLCELSYCEPLEMQKMSTMILQYRTLIETAYFISDKDTDAQVYIFHNTQYIFVCFRGTSSNKDKKTDLNIAMKTFLQRNVKVHKGFHKQYMSVEKIIKNYIDNLIEKYKQADIICCGHSLGGGISTICAVDFKYTKFPKIRIHNVTFGSPRVGNKEFAQLYSQIIKPAFSIRITDENDPITYVPLLYKYHHVDNAYCFCNNSIELKKDIIWYKRLPYALNNINCCRMFKDHCMVNYIELLNYSINQAENN